MDIIINANAVPKLVEFLCHVNKLAKCLIVFLIFSSCAFVILAWICNLNLHGVLTKITSCMSDQTKAVVSAGTVDGSFDHT
jgi:hypothetical protein